MDEYIECDKAVPNETADMFTMATKNSAVSPGMSYNIIVISQAVKEYVEKHGRGKGGAIAQERDEDFTATALLLANYMLDYSPTIIRAVKSADRVIKQIEVQEKKFEASWSENQKKNLKTAPWPGRQIFVDMDKKLIR